MVRSISVVIEFEDGPARNFNTLSEFNTYRFNCWNELTPLDRSAYVREWNSHVLAERRLEEAHRLAPHSLTGACLIFGSRLKAREKLEDPDARAVISCAQTEVKLEVIEESGYTCALIHSGEESWAAKCYLFSYPNSELLLPQFEILDTDSD
jgi:hypothetical protein